VPESYIIVERTFKCNNCEDVLAVAEYELSGFEVCIYCELGFSQDDKIICHKYESDKEGHSHRKCHEDAVKKDRETAPIPPTAKAVGILGVIL